MNTDDWGDIWDAFWEHPFLCTAAIALPVGILYATIEALLRWLW